MISPQQLQQNLAFWIEGYYNRERRHSVIGYFAPIDYKQQFIAAPKLTLANLIGVQEIGATPRRPSRQKTRKQPC